MPNNSMINKFVSLLYKQMEKNQVITLVFIVLILLFFLDHISVSTSTSSIPTTTKTSSNAYIYKQPTTTTIYTSAGKSNPYKAQYYN